jgi:hypothetical protein
MLRLQLCNAELEAMNGRNGCLGLLMILRDSFAKPRWELLGEAAVQQPRRLSQQLPPRFGKGVSENHKQTETSIASVHCSRSMYDDVFIYTKYLCFYYFIFWQ